MTADLPLLEQSVPLAAGPAVPADLRDGYEVLRAALRHGLDVSLYPRQVLMVATADGEEFAFVHGVPDTSTLAAVTYAQDKRMRRELLQRAGLPVPAGASFAIGREVDRAKRFARSVGYPVVVKPTVGDNLSEILPAANEKELSRAIEYLRRPEVERPTFTRTAYALTLLLEPDEEDGRSVAPAKYQFMVEQRPPGDRLRILLIDGEVSSALRLSNDLAKPAWQDVTEDLHQSLRDLAVKAALTVPGLTVVALDLSVADHTRPAGAEVYIMDFSERPMLATQAAVSEGLAQRLGEQILLSRAAGNGLQPTPREEASVEFTIEGATNAPAAVAAICERANASGLVGHLTVVDQVEGRAEGHIQGDPAEVALLFELLLAGQIDRERAMLVRARQVPAAAAEVHQGTFRHLDAV